MSRWFRHYAGMMRDDKLVRVAVKSKQTVERVTWIWGAILESAAEIDDGGRYEIDHEEISYFLRADVDDIAAIEAALAVAGRVADGRVSKWKDRQFQGDRTGGKSRGTEPYVYFIGEAWGAPVKIGFSRNPWSRVLEFQTGSHAKLVVLAAFKTVANSEVDIHTLLSSYRRGGEWFNLPPHATKVVTDAATGKKASYEDLMSMLRDALRSATNTETETELETETNDAASAASSASAPVLDLEDAERRCSEAAGTDELGSFAPIAELLHRQADLERDVLPVIRSRPAGRNGIKSWRYYVPIITEAIPKAAAATFGPPKVFVARDDPGWDAHCRAAKHSPTLTTQHADTKIMGWYFPTPLNERERSAA